MRKVFIAGIALTALIAAPAMAADMPVKAKPIVYYDWTGVYFGLSAGWMGTDITRKFPNPAEAELGGPALNRTTRGDSFALDLHVGAQVQWGHWVVGVEGAIVGCDKECQSYSEVIPAAVAGVGQADAIQQHKLTNLYTLGGRLGYAWDTLLVYATGGAAVATLKGTYCNAFTTPALCGPIYSGTVNGNTTNWGWYVGGGFDWVLHKGTFADLIVGAEAQYFEVDRERAFCTFSACSPPTAVDYDLEAKGLTARARLSIKFNRWGIEPPVVAKY